MQPEPSDWMRNLAANGWAVIPDVIPPSDSEQFEDDVWLWVESFDTDLKQHDPKTWEDDSNWPPNCGGILEHFRIAHAPFMWRLRQRKEILDVFEEIWGTRNLLTSFEGAQLSSPQKPDIPYRSQFRCDQGLWNAGQFECVRGLLNLAPIGPGLGEMIFYDGSHQMHADFCDAFIDEASQPPRKTSRRSPTAVLRKKQLQWYREHGATSVSPTIPRGSLILWDSRTVYAHVRPPAASNICKTGIFLCYESRDGVPDKVNLQRQKLFEERRATKYSAVRPKLVLLNPNATQSELSRFKDQPTVTETTPLMLQLIGFPPPAPTLPQKKKDFVTSNDLGDDPAAYEWNPLPKNWFRKRQQARQQEDKKNRLFYLTE